jgi:ferredoxin like protein
MDHKTETTPSTADNGAGREEMPEVYIDDVLMTLKYYIDEHEAHIRVVDAHVCVGCEKKSCLYFCPVGAYKEDETGSVQLAHQSCIECGSCRIMCPHNNIAWKYPRGGFGVAYKFG